VCSRPILLQIQPTIVGCVLYHLSPDRLLPGFSRFEKDQLEAVPLPPHLFYRRKQALVGHWCMERRYYDPISVLCFAVSLKHMPINRSEGINGLYVTSRYALFFSTLYSSRALYDRSKSSREASVYHSFQVCRPFGAFAAS